MFSAIVIAGTRLQFLLGDGDAGPLGLGRGAEADRAPSKDKLAGIAVVKAAYDLDESRLARAVLTDEPHHLAGSDLEIDLFERVNGAERARDL